MFYYDGLEVGILGGSNNSMEASRIPQPQKGYGLSLQVIGDKSPHTLACYFLSSAYYPAAGSPST